MYVMYGSPGVQLVSCPSTGPATASVLASALHLLPGLHRTRPGARAPLFRTRCGPPDNTCRCLVDPVVSVFRVGEQDSFVCIQMSRCDTHGKLVPGNMQVSGVSARGIGTPAPSTAVSI